MWSVIVESFRLINESIKVGTIWGISLTKRHYEEKHLSGSAVVILLFHLTQFPGDYQRFKIKPSAYVTTSLSLFLCSCQMR